MILGDATEVRELMPGRACIVELTDGEYYWAKVEFLTNFTLDTVLLKVILYSRFGDPGGVCSPHSRHGEVPEESGRAYINTASVRQMITKVLKKTHPGRVVVQSEPPIVAKDSLVFSMRARGAAEATS
jgi:hypothetical protein